MTATYKRWRADVERYQKRGEAWEVIASQHPEIPFTICPILNELHWFEHSESIQEFSTRVKRVARIFGPPEVVDTHGRNGKAAPGMRARWKLDGGAYVEVLVFAPQCRTHPESEYVAPVMIEGKYPEIHPECADVLKELEDCENQPAKE